jgi:hypothetical protein
MTEQTLTTHSPATSTASTATYPPGLAWTTLTAANPSLRSWERSAATAGSRQLGWWCRWATGSRALLSDVAQAIGPGQSDEVFHQALTVARARISEAYQSGVVAAQQARERQAIELRRQAAQAAPPTPRRRWTAWRGAATR